MTRPKAPPVMGHRETDLFNGGHAPHAVVHGMGLPDVGELRYLVQLRRGQGEGGGIDHQEPLPVALEDCPAPVRVVFLILHLIGLGIGPLVLPHVRKGGTLHLGKYAGGRVPGQKGGAPHVPNGPHRRAGGQPGGNLSGGALPHAVHQQVRLTVQQDAPAHLVLPVVIVGEPPQGGLQPADDDGQALKGLPRPVGVDNHRPVRPQAPSIPWGIGVVVAAFSGGGVVGHHRINVSPGNQHPQPGAAQGGERGGAVPVRLGQDGHPVPLRLQQAGDNGGPERGVVHVGVPGNDQEIIPVPAPFLQVPPGDWQKGVVVTHRLCFSPTYPALPVRPVPRPPW